MEHVEIDGIPSKPTPLNPHSVFLSDFGAVLKDAALMARADAVANRASQSSNYSVGRAAAYYEVIALALAQARKLAIPDSHLRLAEVSIEPELIVQIPGEPPALCFPSKEDLTKIHQEVNIFINQRWTLVISAISIVGAVLAWISQKVVPADPSTVALLFIGTSLLLSFLTLIAFIDATLHVNEVIHTTFLRMTSSSPWEAAVERFRDPFKSGIYQLTGKRVTLLGLGLLVSLWPFVLLLALSVTLVRSPFLSLHCALALGFVFALLVVFPRMVNHQRRRIAKLWSRALTAPK